MRINDGIGRENLIDQIVYITGKARQFYQDMSPYELAMISIHAPMWGATDEDKQKASVLINFNPRTHVGCDLIFLFHSSIPPNFNPRTHVGCDEMCENIFCISKNFNPRTHVGCDFLFR